MATNPPASTHSLQAGELRGSPQVKRGAAAMLVTSHQATKSTGAPSQGFRWYWLAWAALSLAAFLVPELYVVATGRMDLTLSDTLRAVLGIDPPSKGKAVGAAGFAVLLATGVTILIIHITAGWPG